MRRSILFGIVFYLILAVISNAKLILMDGNSMIMIPEDCPLTFNNYLRIMVGTWTWNDFLSQRSWGLDFLSYRLSFWAIGLLFNISLTQLLVLERALFQFLAFLGAFFLSKDYLRRLSEKKGDNHIPLTSFIAGLVYGLNPSYMIGDSFWIGIQFSFASLPWVMWSFNKVILFKKWKYAILCALLMALNVDEHFLWVGFPMILALYAGFLFVVKTLRNRRICFTPILGFFLVILIFVGIVPYRFGIRFAGSSPYQFSMTKLGVDVCWTQASMTNMLRAMDHMELSSVYATTHPILSVLNLLMPLTLLISILAFASFLFYKRNWVIGFFGILLIISILPFFSGSPFKQLHYWMFFNTPFGPAFRTWRVPDAYIALSLGVLVAFSLYYIFQKLSNKRKYLTAFAISSMIFALTIYSWPLLTGDINGRLAPIRFPNEYSEAYSFLSNKSEDLRVAYIPEFIYSYGKDANLKPFWSPEWGAVQESLTFSSPKPTFWPIGQWGHFYDFTLSPLYFSLLRTGETETLALFLRWADVKYVVVHNDVPTMEETIHTCLGCLNKSLSFKLVFHNNIIYVYENQFDEKKVTISSETLLVDGGYRVVKYLYNALTTSNSTSSFIFLDQKVTPEVLEKVSIVVTDKTEEQLMNDLIFVKELAENSGYVIYPYDCVIEHDPQRKWSRASYLDPHQQVWHPYVNWQDYSWDFDYMKGLVFTNNSNDSIVMPLDLESSGEYVVLLRFFANEKGGKITLNVDNNIFEIRTANEYNGFFWYDASVNLDESKTSVAVRNDVGFNAISAISIIPKQDYEKLVTKAVDYISNKEILNVAPNLISNPSFEDALSNWKMDDNVIMDDKFDMLLDNSIVFGGNYSLKVFTDHSKSQYGWSWIRGNWIDVEEGEEYQSITHMKTENVNASHIILEAYDEPNDRVFQLAQVPSAKYGSSDWQICKYSFIVPQNTTKIRVVLNAGWSNQNGTLAVTWFDDVKLIPVESKYNTFNLPIENDNKLVSWTEVDPTKHTLEVNASQSFMLSFSEAYDPLWVCYVNGERISSIPLYGVFNGFWINKTGQLDIVIEYEPQNWFYTGCAISITTFLACTAYLAYSYTKTKHLLQKLTRHKDH